MATNRTYEDALNPEKALIFRIVHVNNLPWILDNGLYCGNSAIQHPQWVSIGNADLTNRRATHAVKAPYEGLLNDYVPFYFTPFSPMFLNIKSGRNGVTQRPNSEIAILVSSLHKIQSEGRRFLFTDAHAYFVASNYYHDLSDLNKIDWSILQRRDFQRDPENDPRKVERYQAEALVHDHLPVASLLGIVCYSPAIENSIKQELLQRQLKLSVFARPAWYFQ
ncbi:hypothetical protein M2375_000907 [Comamonas sp. BIGb0152]|uniref:type II toxin-antitoxin system toxin DNA ADP-ribosyl transferase DarT n=1 Tax=Comamonas sp. BIGb0152 TaxID=2940601 RepID=UPI00216726AC|nr:DUF4433 domain-containing protein [Comamonas sp. BIGb0152]MCS4292701.1 hypothetical protein [Comamonas sp. BIGb0152]